MKKNIPIFAVLAAAFLIVGAVGYFALIRPKGAESARLQEQITELDAKVTEARLAQRQLDRAPVIKVADLFDLSKAMPDKEDMAGVILELNSVAASTGIRFIAITPQGTAARDGYKVQPIQLTFHGNYFDLTDFLFRMRNLVTVRDGVLRASGRLFTLDNIDFHESPINGFPEIEAVLVVSAYVFDTASRGTGVVTAPVAPTDTTTTTTATTTSADTTAATTTAPSTQALGGTP
ncbi:MAG: type 4a pilus biogenesis protein PilO [Gaiellaceae bacterium]